MKKSIAFVLILSSILFLSCSLMYNKNTYIQIFNCEHGSIDVQLTGEDFYGSEYLIIAHPENGYCLKYENLFIYTDSFNSTNGYYQMDVYHRLMPMMTSNNNIFIFEVGKESKVSINAFFTKIE